MRRAGREQIKRARDENIRRAHKKRTLNFMYARLHRQIKQKRRVAVMRRHLGALPILARAVYGGE
eukprot:6214807-Pleurochrysis_carterae.AAC.4